VRDYFEDILKAIDKMTDEEFDELLLQSGLERCPIIQNEESEANCELI
jgi:hypothetical protein